MRFKKIYIEVTNNCNLNCSFCSGHNRKKMFIDTNDFKNILDKIKPYTEYIYLHVMGEPLLHPNINELINIASKNFKINITTNGYLIKRIVNTNIRQINISLHSFNDKYNKTIEEYMNDIFSVVDNLNNTYISYRLWVNSKDSNNIKKILENKYNVEINDEQHIKLNDHIFLDIESEFIWPSLDNDYYNEIGTCKGTIDHIGILVDGTIIPCCLDSNGIINLGNIYKNDLSDIISRTRFIKMNNGFKNNKKEEELCKKCNFYSR